MIVTTHILLFAFNSITRTHHFSADSMNYVSVARNVTAGKGITQPTLGFNQPRFSANEEIPTPFTSQPPLYPLLIALVSQIGISYSSSALLVSAISYGIVLWLAFALAFTLYDQSVALLTLGLLPLYFPLHFVATYAWSEPTGIAFLLLSLWLFVQARARSNLWWNFSSGLATGLAFGTRYSLLPLFFIGVIFLLIRPEDHKQKLPNLCSYTAGFSLPFGVILGRNFLVSGAIMPSANPSDVGLWENIIAALKGICEGYLNKFAPPFEAALLVLSLLTFGIAFLLKRDARHSLQEVFYSQKRYLLVLWSLGYLIFLIAERTHSHFDYIQTRLIVPVGVTLTILWSALAIRATGAAYVKVFVLILLLASVRREALVAMRPPPPSLEQAVLTSGGLTWVAQHTSDSDLIIGNHAVDIPFYLGRQYVLGFSPYPSSDYPTYEEIMAYCRRHCDRYKAVYLVLRNEFDREEDWKKYYGSFFADIAFGRTEKYPDVIFLQRLHDAWVYRIQCN